MFIITAYDLLGNALIEVMVLQNSFEMIIKEVKMICARWKITDDVIL